MKKNLIILCLIVLLSQAVWSQPGPASEIMLGDWTIDIESIKITPEFITMAEQTPQEQKGMLDGMLAMFESFKMTIERTTMTVEMEAFGESQVETSEYRIIAEEDNTLTITNVNEDGSDGEIVYLTILDHNKIQLKSADNSEPFPMIFIRIIEK